MSTEVSSAARADGQPTGPAPDGSGPSRTRRRRTRWRLGVLLVVLALAAGVTTAVLILRPEEAGAPAPQRAAWEFLDRYVDPDGRVVRRDQGGDTVSEGQAYAMLLAVAVGDQRTFRTVWSWTSAHLGRPDGLLSWHWAGGAVTDPNSASDADLDAARALTLAGRRFADPELLDQGMRMAAAVLTVDTARISPLGPGGSSGGLVLTAGSWVTGTPVTINPSYGNPRAQQLFAAGTADPRWRELSSTGRALARQLTSSTALPPDWATVTAAGVATPAAAPDGESVRFGLDAPRLLLRMAESCDPADRAVAADLLPALTRPLEQVRGSYALDGTPLVAWAHPLSFAALAAGATASGRPGADATRWLTAAEQLDRRAPSYYGAAWTALAEIMLETDLLGSCTNLDGA